MAALQARVGCSAASLRQRVAVTARAAAPAPGGLGLALPGRRRRGGSGAKSGGSPQPALRPARAAAEKELDFALIPWDSARETW